MSDVSIVVATYRRPALLAQSLESAFVQEGMTIEAIVVDDDPAASARAVAEGAGARYIVRAQNSGGRPGLVRNEGLALARAPLVRFLDDDDLLPPDSTAALREALRDHPRAAFAFGTVEPFGGDAAALAYERRYFARAARAARRASRWRPALLAALLYGNAPLVTSAALFRRADLLRLGGFDSALPVCEDLDLFVRAARDRGAAFVDQVVLRYRVGGTSLAHRADAAAQIRAAYGRIHDRYRAAHGPLESLALKLVARPVRA